MGWFTTYVKNPAGRAGRFAQRHAGKIARDSAVIGAGVAGSLIPGCGPLCGAAAAYATQEWLGDPIERSTKRVIDKGGAAADDFVGYLQGGKEAPRPPGLATSVSGTAGATTVKGDSDETGETSGAAVTLALAAGAVATTTITLLALRRAGRI